MIKPHFKRTKILATIGPATHDYDMIYRMIQEGVNGCRLNFSHGDYAEKTQVITWIRQASFELKKPVAIVQDLQGPKIRLGMFNDNVPVVVKAGDELILDSVATDWDGQSVIPVQYNLADKVKPGEAIYINDGKVKTEMVGRMSDVAIRVRVLNNGEIRARKGLNLPDTDFGGDILTEKDLQDIEFGTTQDIDYVALSFVQSASDIAKLRQILREHGSQAQIIAKIETKLAIAPDQLEAIVEVTDGIMVARGDLAVEAGAEVVPAVQDRLMQLCRKHAKMIIVATQMLASMVDSPEPTRAEASDVALAVMQGADDVMLSDETANGHYPLETVMAMKKIILYTQNNTVLHDYPVDKTDTNLNAIAVAAVEIADQLKAQAIVVSTETGATAIKVAAVRPNRVILSVTANPRVAQQLALRYANQTYIRKLVPEIGYDLASQLKRAGRFDETENDIKVVIVSGSQSGVVGGTDTIQIRTI